MILLASLRICKMDVVAKEMGLVVRILLEALVILNVFEDHLAEAVEVCNIYHLGIHNLAHERTRRALIVNLDRN